MLNVISGALSGGAAPDLGAYEAISTVTVGSATSSISLTSIPSTYKHLQIRMIGNSSAFDAAVVTFNSDTGANYTRHRLSGNGSAAAAGATTGMSGAYINSAGGYPSTSNIFGASVIDILDYTNTNKYTTIRTLSGEDLNGTGWVEMTSNLWLNTAAITRIDIAALGGNWNTNSAFALYGIKG